MRTVFFAGVLVLSGCVTGTGIPAPSDLLSAANGRFAGHPVEGVIAHYGAPDSQFDAAGGIRVLLWNNTATRRLHDTVRSTTTGRVGNGFASVPYRETTDQRVGYNVDFACTMQVGVRPDGTVDAVAFDGRMGACQDFMP